MLENSLFESQRKEKTQKPLTVVISAGVHVVTIGILLLVPLLHTQGVTLQPVDLSLWAPVTEQPKPVTDVISVQPDIQQTVQTDPDALVTPQEIPRQIAPVVDEPTQTTIQLLPSTRGSAAGSVLEFLNSRKAEGDEEPRPGAPPPPPPPPPVVQPTRIRTGGDVQQGKIIHQVQPVYPQLARQARIQGTVQLDAVIGRDGTVQSLRVISGHPLLTQAALDAVQQWRYRPTLLNGEPVEVTTTINVTFTFR